MTNSKPIEEMTLNECLFELRRVVLLKSEVALCERIMGLVEDLQRDKYESDAREAYEAQALEAYHAQKESAYSHIKDMT